MGSEPALERSEGVTQGDGSTCEGLFFKIEPCLSTTTVVMKAHESLFCWSQWALPVHDAAHDAFMALPPHTTSSREDDVRPVVEGARTGRKSRWHEHTQI